MFNTAYLHERFRTEKTTPAVRLIGTIFAISCTLPAIASTIFYPALIVALPGVILTIFYYRIMLNRSEYGEARAIFNFTMIYNAILGGLVIYHAGINPFESTISINVIAFGLAALANLSLREATHLPN